MEIVFKNYKYKDNNLNFTIENKEINGIITDNIEEIVDIIKLKLKYNGKVVIDGETIKTITSDEEIMGIANANGTTGNTIQIYIPNSSN